MLSEDELALLDAIRATGSLSRAAARLGKAPSTVSHAARQLETRFDALLFDRRGYRLQLTPAGQLLTDEAARLALDVARLTQRVRQVASGWEDRLWIVSDEVLEFDTLLPVVRAFDALDSGRVAAFHARSARRDLGSAARRARGPGDRCDQRAAGDSRFRGSSWARWSGCSRCRRAIRWPP